MSSSPPPAPSRATLDAAVDTRRAVHAQPELAFAEVATTALVRRRLLGLGLAELPCPTETGAVFELRGGRPGKSVLLRADIDALPVQEETTLPFRSRVDGAMHACGHDGHVAILLGVAETLAARAEDLPGRFVLLFQPGEEFGFGARKMIEGGVLEAVRADSVLGLHVAAPLPTGLVAVRPGVQYSRAQQFRVLLEGAGAHAAMAGSEGNVVLAVAELTRRLGGVVEGMEHDWVQCACSAGAVHAGTASNVVPRQARLEGTFRTFDDGQYQEALRRLRALCDGVAAEFSVRCALELSPQVPEVVNDVSLTRTFREVARPLLGDSLIEAPPVQPSDDVSEFMRRIPGVYFLLGARPGGRLPPQHHAPDFDFDEACLEVGIRTMVAGALGFAAA